MIQQLDRNETLLVLYCFATTLVGFSDRLFLNAKMRIRRGSFLKSQRNERANQLHRGGIIGF